MRRQSAKSGLLIFPHEAAIAEDVGTEYGGELTFQYPPIAMRLLLQARCRLAHGIIHRLRVLRIFIKLDCDLCQPLEREIGIEPQEIFNLGASRLILACHAVASRQTNVTYQKIRVTRESALLGGNRILIPAHLAIG